MVSRHLRPKVGVLATIERKRRTARPALTDFAAETWAALATAPTGANQHFDPASLDGLPAPARRYLASALPRGAPLSSRVELGMEGEIKLGGRWLRFTAEQILRAEVGFVWAPVVGGRILRFVGADALGPDGARIEFRFQGRVPVAKGRGADVRRSAQGRLAAETVAWLPQALTPQAGARWVGVDDHRSVVTINAAGDDIDIEVAVDDDGHLRSLGLQRWNDSAKPPGYAPFGGTVDSAHVTEDGVRIAGSGAVGWEWQTPRQSDGVFFRYRITAANFPDTSPESTRTA